MTKNKSKKSKHINVKSQTNKDSSTSSIASVNSNNTTTSDGFTIGSLHVHDNEHANTVTLASNINVTQV